MIAWFARNPVAANLLFIGIVLAGLWSLSQRLVLEVFPSFERDRIDVSIVLPGATPSDVEESVLLPVEEAISGIIGISEIVSTATEGRARLSLEVEGREVQVVKDDVRNAVDSLTGLPDDAERAAVTVPIRRRALITVMVHGALQERELRELGETIADDLSRLALVQSADLEDVRPYEIRVEIPERNLRQYSLTLQQVATAIRSASIDQAGGEINASGGDLLIRTSGRLRDARPLHDIIISARADGSQLRLSDIATIDDGFDETPIYTRFNGEPAVTIEIERGEDQSAIEVADAVKEYIVQQQALMPQGVSLSYWRDRSRIVKARLATLLDSAWQGGLMIFIVLALFLRFSLALWVCLGIPMSFMGALIVMPELGVSLNIISLFAFIVVLGVVVDDAIVTGENIYTHLKNTPDSLHAAIEGTREIALPVTMGVLTTAIAFVPLLFLGGYRGPIFAQIPAVVIPVLLFSLLESKLILPAHLRHARVYGEDRTRLNPLARLQRKIADGMEAFVRHIYQPALAFALRWRYAVVAAMVAISMLITALVISGRVLFVFFPRVQSEIASATLSMPVGTPFAVTERHLDRIANAADALRDRHVEPDGSSVIRNISATYGGAGSAGSGQSHLGRVRFEILAPEERTSSVTSRQLVNEWRKMIGEVPGARELSFRAELGRGGSPLDIEISGNDSNAFPRAVEAIRAQYATYSGITEITDSLQPGKEEVRLKLRPGAAQLGLTLNDLSSQVRAAFFGIEARRIQRGRDDVEVLVRFPPEERRSIANLDSMRIRTASGVDVPFASVAAVEYGTGYSVISRIDRRRVINVTADVDKATADVEAIKTDLRRFMTDLEARYGNLTFTLEGEDREQRETFGSLQWGALAALFGIYALLAIAFRSYVQPVIVMSVIPLGVTGAIVGHIIMGMPISMPSMLGMLALSGVVVNDSLVLVDWINRRESQGDTLLQAAEQAGAARFRAVILTSLTTFAGLIPLIFWEKTTQAQFLIPMAVSLGFGILFATVVTLFVVPLNTLILHDLRVGLRRVFLKPADR
ncbi:efflux RND transporter permease subunit [Gammaproteobacteria bacterium]|nr:efflux RND transporter permease subunit [Gammaproteobacteria bacterium]